MNTHNRLSYTVPEAIAATGFTRTRIYGAIGDGSLKTWKEGRRRMISAKALQDFIAKRERESAGRAA
jgi:hypothetical protein